MSVTLPETLFLALIFMAPASPFAMMASVDLINATTESFFLSPSSLADWLVIALAVFVSVHTD